MHLSIETICDFGLFSASNNIRSRLELCMVILKIRTSVFLCHGASINIPAELPARSWVVFDEKITNTSSWSFILYLVKNFTDKTAN